MPDQIELGENLWLPHRFIERHVKVRRDCFPTISKAIGIEITAKQGTTELRAWCWLCLPEGMTAAEPCRRGSAL